MTRRGFILRSLAALPLVAASRLLRLAPSVPVLYGDGVHDDTLALRAWGAGRPVNNPDGTPLGAMLRDKKFVLRETLVISRKGPSTILCCHFDVRGIA